MRVVVYCLNTGNLNENCFHQTLPNDEKAFRSFCDSIFGISETLTNNGTGLRMYSPFETFVA